MCVVPEGLLTDYTAKEGLAAIGRLGLLTDYMAKEGLAARLSH